jgi:dienelactone hydrolase
LALVVAPLAANWENWTMKPIESSLRRHFLQQLSAAGVTLPYWTGTSLSAQDAPGADSADIGTLYSQIEGLALQNDYPLSYLSGDYPGPAAYRRAVRDQVFRLFCYNPPPVDPAPEVVGRWEYEDYVQEKILFSTTPWFRVPAYVLSPRKFSGRRPGIVDLHSHGGMFVFGKEKVMPIPGGDHPAITEYRKNNYDGVSTSLELCRRGYVVVSIDCFYFGERRTHFSDLPRRLSADRDSLTVSEVQQVNRRAGQGEETLAKSLFWAGTTWQGIAHWDDIRTVDYLISRSDVDPERIGCLGISMGGDRTDYLAGLDERIRCAVSIGWMSTLREMIPHHVNTHSFMHFLPGLTRFIDLPDLIGCMVPKPLFVQYCRQDNLYPLDGMEKSRDRLLNIYRKGGAPDRLEARFYDRPHMFGLEMQQDAYQWLDRWLEPDQP